MLLDFLTAASQFLDSWGPQVAALLGALVAFGLLRRLVGNGSVSLSERVARLEATRR